MWSCVVEFQQQKTGKVNKPIRQVVFNDIYPDKNSMREKDQPIRTNMLQHIKPGAPVAYYDNCGEIREGSFLCHQKQHKAMTPIDIISDVLSSDEEIRSFCKENKIGSSEDHLFRMVVQAQVALGWDLNLRKLIWKIPTNPGFWIYFWAAFLNHKNTSVSIGTLRFLLKESVFESFFFSFLIFFFNLLHRSRSSRTSV